MSIKVALHHRTSYHYDRPIHVGPQVIRLRPAPHSRTPIDSYSLRVTPENHFINWQQDPFGNFLARVVFEEKITELTIDIDLIADMSVINPFDFFVEEKVEKYPFEYSKTDLEELKPYLEKEPAGPLFTEYLSHVKHDFDRTIDFLVALNGGLEKNIDYLVRMEPGVQSCEETLKKRSGSCRDSAWLLVQLLRHQGLAARFTSGYLIQLTPDVKSLDGPSGTDVDFTDLHAWAEVFLPGAGWIGLDPTSGLMTGEGHIPLASTPKFSGAAPITGCLEECETEFGFGMSVVRVHEDPRVTKPYSEEQWNKIDQLGQKVDEKLLASDVRLTMGGEPTFISIDSPDDPQWQTEALGEEKNSLANDLMGRMKARTADGPLLHHGQGKWYPGEPLPRWSKTCFWRSDGLPLWENEEFLAEDTVNYGHDAKAASNFISGVADRLGVDANHVSTGYEDPLYHLWQEQRLPANVDLDDAKYRDSIDRKRLSRVLEQGLEEPVGCILPLQFQWWLPQPRWMSSPWKTRADKVYLIPGDSPMGYRLPLKTLVQTPGTSENGEFYPLDPMVARSELPVPEQLRARFQSQHMQPASREAEEKSLSKTVDASPVTALAAGSIVSAVSKAGEAAVKLATEKLATEGAESDVARSDRANGEASVEATADANGKAGQHGERFHDNGNGHAAGSKTENASESDSAPAIPLAVCVEARGGTLHVFMPPTERLEHYLELLAAVEDTACELNLPVIIEGYKPPTDHRLKHFSITPDPGVIEVNVQPASSWDELKQITEGLYDDAYHSRLGTEKFELDGTHSGTGGGNHFVLGGSTPADSPLLRRPDLLRSLIGFWQNHPSLSYLFSGRFIGPTSQAPRVDEARADTLYELQIAFDELDRQGDRCPPWLVDRLFRHLLTDLTGNTHRSEFCIDKLFSPDSETGRLGLVEFRGFEMPPHAQMSLTQQLLLRTLIARFWETPYVQPLVDWKTRLHDQFMLPHFIWRDFDDVIKSCQQSGYELETEWFASHLEFRFPRIGSLSQNALQLELRQAIEPWNVLGEENAGGGTARYVDSSVERMQVLVRGFVDERYTLTCNGRKLPLHPTETLGEYVAGVRYRAWQPPNCLHPTIPVDGPLTFDIFDNWLDRSVDGCRYHVGHPGGLNPTVFPVNSYEAESRRAARFSRIGHSGSSLKPRSESQNRDFPMTLDLRKDRT